MDSRAPGAILVDDDERALKARFEIEALAASYAWAIDALYGGDVEGARSILRTCFTADAVFTGFLPSSDRKGPPDSSAVGPDGVVDAALALKYAGAQHHMGNFRIDVHGDTATMTSYLTAVGVIHWSSSIDFIAATYTDHLVHTPDGWRIARRLLDVTCYLRLESPSARDVEKGIDSVASAYGAAVGAAKVKPLDASSPRSTRDWALLKDQMEIRALSTVYGYAADAIGRGDLDEGKRLWAACFAEDGLLESFLPSDDPDAPPVGSLRGPDALSEGARGTFELMGYAATQHHMGNHEIHVDGDTATMRTCVTATHWLHGGRRMDLAPVTYTDRLVRTSNGWRIAYRRLQVTSFVRLESAPPAAGEQPAGARFEGVKGAGVDLLRRIPANAGAGSREGSLPQDLRALKAYKEIEALAVTYAYAADALGRGDVEEGRRLIATCFTEDAAFAAFFTSDGPDAAPFFSSVGPDAWAEKVSEGFRALGCTATRHHVGNIQITMDGDTATMTSYVTATHVKNWSSSIVLATVTYTDTVVRTPDGFRISARRLQASGALHMESPKAASP